MLDTSLALRYARALFKITKASGNAKIVGAELLWLCNLIDTIRELKRVLYHPGITALEKKNVLFELLDQKVSAITIRFMNFIIQKKRIFHLASMAKCFETLLAEEENRKTVKVESFKPLPEDTLQKLKENLASLLKMDITLIAEVKPSLLGGLRLTLGDKVIDGSISNQLRNLTQIVTAV